MSVLDNEKKIYEIDSEDMYAKIIHMPEQIMDAYNNFDPHYPDNFPDWDISKIERIVICGMGGSAISGDIAAAAFNSIIPISVVKDYNIPYVDEKTLVICISYSGNTEETLSCLQQA
ncbi:MAG: SIS domain-containing protein, partial [Candidatus Cloacimonadota bacterium]|nr:SIS domain-containing protein [Candidatus Cloacimonadota bacterium]